MDKKTLIYGLIAVIIIAGIVWYAGQNEDVSDQMASLMGVEKENEEGVEKPELEIEDLVLGSPDAPVTILEYSSHFCGHCANFHEDTLPLIMEKYVQTGKVKIIQRTLGVRDMGRAIFCAAEQDKFSQFNEYTFEHIEDIETVDDLDKLAAEAGLNQADFKKCFNSQKYTDKVQRWYTQAQEAGITGTPSFFVNDQLIVGNQPYSVFEEAIEKELNNQE